MLMQNCTKQEGLMGVIIKSMFNDRPNNHDTQGSEHYNPVLRLVTTPFLESMLHTNSINQYWCTCHNIIISARKSWILKCINIGSSLVFSDIC